MLRLLTYLAPSLPLELFQTIADHVASSTGLPTTLLSDARTSGPRRGLPDPFSTGDADVGFLCAPSYSWLRDITPCPVDLLPVALVPLDPRAAGRPVYFSDVIVRADDPARTFDDLAARSFAYNDPCSMSGYFCLLERLAARGLDTHFFSRLVEAGSHLTSLRLVDTGECDAAAIDSNVLSIALSRTPSLAPRLRILESWGPFPIQPIVARSTLPTSTKNLLTTSLSNLPPTSLTPFHFAGTVFSSSVSPDPMYPKSLRS